MPANTWNPRLSQVPFATAADYCSLFPELEHPCKGGNIHLAIMHTERCHDAALRRILMSLNSALLFSKHAVLKLPVVAFCGGASYA
jgi:hypothetical protein